MNGRILLRFSDSFFRFTAWSSYFSWPLNHSTTCSRKAKQPTHNGGVLSFVFCSSGQAVRLALVHCLNGARRHIFERPWKKIKKRSFELRMSSNYLTINIVAALLLFSLLWPKTGETEKETKRIVLIGVTGAGCVHTNITLFVYRDPVSSYSLAFSLFLSAKIL